MLDSPLLQDMFDSYGTVSVYYVEDKLRINVEFPTFNEVEYKKAILDLTTGELTLQLQERGEEIYKLELLVRRQA